MNRQYAACAEADDFYEWTAFEILRVEKVTLGVFENNEPAYQCYQSVGFETVAMENPESYHVMGEDWKCIEMEMTRQKFVNMTN